MLKNKNLSGILNGLIVSCISVIFLMPSALADDSVTGGVPVSGYKHTYHTKISGAADITINYTKENGELDHKGYDKVTYESEFVKGNLSDSEVQAEIAIYEKKVSERIANAKVLSSDRSARMVFDHFESSNIIGTDENLTGSISKKLDVHEYQVYNINHKYTIELPCETEVKSDFKPQIVKGANSSWTKGLNKGLEFKSNADYSGFLSVIVDGKEIDSSCYEKKAGSIIITLKPDYLKTLSLGSHYVIIKSLQGEALTNFIIKEPKVENDDKLNNESRENNPIFFKTSDSTNLGLWIALLTVSGFAFLFLIISSKIKSGKNSI